jgi:3-deoxy-D-manno-octulosonic-acid transferase
VVSRLLDADAAIEASDEASLKSAIAGLLRAPERRAELARRALDIVRAHEGAGERTARLLLGEEKSEIRNPKSEGFVLPH